MHLERHPVWAVAGALLALAACQKSSGGDARNLFAAHGGRGTAGAGGEGGMIRVMGWGAQLRVQTSGRLPALPTWTYTRPALGDNPLTISRDETVTVGGPLQGDDPGPATGIWVQEGATLTLAPGVGSTVVIAVPEGVLVEGTIAMAPLPGSRDASSLTLHARNLAIRGALRAVGGSGAAGQDGGRGGDVAAQVGENVFVTGSLLATGGAGDGGGDGGGIEVTVAGPPWTADVTPSTIVVAGLIDSSGGEGRSGAGGDAGATRVQGDWTSNGACDFFNSGTIRSRGGDGTTGGGDGATLFAGGCAVGSAVSTGTLDGSGGAATVDGPGGAANLDTGVALLASEGTVYAGGSLLATGGAGARSGSGGAGGRADIETFGYVKRDPLPSMRAHVAARIDASGGDGAKGGPGGKILLWDQPPADTAPTDTGITLYDYAALEAVGGAGTTAGGKGGSAGVQAYERATSTPATYVLGSCVNEVPIDVSGGAASAGGGGDAGTVLVGSWVIAVPRDQISNADAISTLSTGAIRARGGDGTTSGGKGGGYEGIPVLITDLTSATSRGLIDVGGGGGGTGAGGPGGSVDVFAFDEANASGAIAASGGASAGGDGGAGGVVWVGGATTASLGAVTADGGAASRAKGGAGGAVTLLSSTPPSKLTGTISVRGGAGATAGAVGTFQMDMVAMTLTDGRYSPP